MRYLARFALPFCGAIFLCCYVPAAWLAWVIAAVSAAGFALCLWKADRHRVPLCLFLAGVCLGAAWFGGYRLLFVRPASALADTQSAFTAEVAEYPQETDYGVSTVLRIESGAGEGKRVQVWLSDYYGELKPGDTMRGTITYATVLEQSYTTPVTKGVFLQGSVQVAEVYSAPGVPLRYALQGIGHWVKETAQNLFSGEEGALLSGLLTGDKSALSDATYSNFRRAGMAHLLAVSGLHVGFLTGVLYLLPGQKKRRIVVSIPVLVGFAAMTGGSSSVWRAVVMAALLMIAPLFQRESDSITSVSFALLVLLAQNPYAAQSVSLQLSFAAVTGLVCFYPSAYQYVMRPWKTKWKKKQLWRVCRGVASAVLGSVTAACCAVVLTLPLSMWYFETVSLVGPLSNVLALWAASAAFVGGALVCLLSAVFPAGAAALAVPVRWLLTYLLRVARWLGRWKLSALRLDNVYLVAWLWIAMALIAGVIFLRPLRRHPVFPLLSGGVLFVAALILHINSVSGLPLTVSVLDVGQGSSAVFCSKGSFVAVDCGGSDAGTVLADFVQSGWGDSLAALVLTHYDSDHINGLDELLERISVEKLYLPDVKDDSDGRQWVEALAEEYDCPVCWVDETTSVAFGEATLTVYPPVENEDDTDNADSLSALCSQGAFYALVTGDMGQVQEQALIERENLPKLDVLVAGHHGSNNATGTYLLRALRPDAAMISVSAGNSYGLPDEETLMRLETYQCKIYRTDLDGTVTLRHR